MPYVTYLRKSRTDTEAELRGEGETLARHEKALIELAKRQKLNLTGIYREVVSGETIAARPIMQKLLLEVEQGIWDGVLVMEIERLARGDTIDQGIMAQAFKFSNTKIITPMKTYDPNNEFDEEYFEFGLFMSRREYKTINRRLQRGRITSVKEGKYVGNQPPYGYLRKKLVYDKGFTLVPHPEQSGVVKMIFDWYTNGILQLNGTYKRLGISLIVRELNKLGIKPQRCDVWTVPSIRDMLINPVYTGKIRWNFRPAVKQISEGKITKSRPRSKNFILVDGLHEPIIDYNVFEQAQYNMTNNPPRPIGEKGVVKNPLAGLVICGKCGRSMVRRPHGPQQNADILMCPSTSCDNVSSTLHSVEEKIINSLCHWTEDYRIKWNLDKDGPAKDSQTNVIEKSIKKSENQLELLYKQLDNLHNLLEQGIYTTDIFLSRSKLICDLIEQNKKDIITLSSNLLTFEIKEESRTNIIPKIEDLLEVYYELPSPKEKNDLLKEVLKRVSYTKEFSGRWHNEPDSFDIIIYPIITHK